MPMPVCKRVRVSDFFYNLILFMNENEQNNENWQIKINNFFALFLRAVSLVRLFGVIQKASSAFGAKGRL